MMFEKSPAASYDAGISKLEKAERHYRQTLDALQSALDLRRASEVPALRRKAAEAEQALAAALEAASAGWRNHWLGRVKAIEPHLLQAAQTINKYNALCRVVGVGGVTPAQSFIQNALINPAPVELDDESGVPIDEPDSAVLEDFKGCWR